MSKQVLNDAWYPYLRDEFKQDYMLSLKQFLRQQKDAGKIILPHSSLWFNALNSVPFEKVKVVVLGQDPYPTKGHAHGLCFSVMPEVSPLPKSLLNIYKELQDDLGIQNTSGYLQPWTEQGVLLLNSVLTVEQGKSNSHQGRGWETFTDKIIYLLNRREQPMVFVLWGSYAQKKGNIIDGHKHKIIYSPHPSPLSAYRGFFGSCPFSTINQFLQHQGQSAINWQL